MLNTSLGGDAACVICRTRCPKCLIGTKARNQPGDRWARAELNHGVVEFVAPTEYMVRPPQPAVYIFLIDVSHASVQSGMVATATRTILENLDRIPDENGRTKVAIICYDVSLYFFSIPVRHDVLTQSVSHRFVARLRRVIHARCIRHR